MTVTGSQPQLQPGPNASYSSSLVTITSTSATPVNPNSAPYSDTTSVSNKPTPSIHGSVRSSSKGDGAPDPRAFYHPSVVTSPPTSAAPSTTHVHDGSASSSTSLEPQYNPRRSSALPLGSTNAPPPTATTSQKKANRYYSMLPPARVPEAYTATTSHYSSSPVDPKPYSAVTEDNMMVIPTSSTSDYSNYTTKKPYGSSGMTEDNLMVMPSSSSASTRSKRSSMRAPIDTSDIDSISTSTSTSRLQTKATRRHTLTSPLAMQQPILQPKPMKPLKNVPVNLNLQLQIAEEENTEQHEGGKSSAKRRVKSQMRKSFGGLGLGKHGSGGGHGLSLFGGPRSRESSSKGVDGLASTMEESFLLVEG